MNLNITFTTKSFAGLKRFFKSVKPTSWIAWLSLALAILASWYSFRHDYIVAYGDAESHLNIAKRVVDSLTPGFAQLGGIWLPLPHLFLLPFVYFDFLWRTGLAGSIVSGVCFVISSVFLFKIAFLLTRKTGAAWLTALAFMLNPNVLYLQSTPMTELTLMVFFILSSYFFLQYLEDKTNALAFLAAAGFAFLAALSRYDGWSLVCLEALAVFLVNFPFQLNWKAFWLSKQFSQLIQKQAESKAQVKALWKQLEGKTILFSTLAFFGIFLWLGWGWLILGDPIYFTHSQFSAKSQQLAWQAKGELPAYQHIWTAFVYYFVASLDNAGVILFVLGIVGFLVYLFKSSARHKLMASMVLLTPFVFYMATLYLGQSIMFLPGLTPTTFEWTLFNARYGVMMVPIAAIFVGYLFYVSKSGAKALIACLLVFQLALFGIGYAKVISLEDGVVGLSEAKRPDAEQWMAQNYTGGLVLLDDYSRLISIIRAGIPMQNVIYIGNKPYWEQSLQAPEKYATWVIVQQGDAIWQSIYQPPAMQGRLYKYFQKAYTSPDILIFKRNPGVPAPSV
jgi:hypothetical protein